MSWALFASDKSNKKFCQSIGDYCIDNIDQKYENY